MVVVLRAGASREDLLSPISTYAVFNTPAFLKQVIELDYGVTHN